MNRRHFVKTTSGIMVVPWLPNLVIEDLHNSSLVEQLIMINDSKVAGRMESQIKDPDHRWYGGSPNQYDIPNAGSSCALIRDLSCAYCSNSSDYYLSDEVINAVNLASQYLLNIQYEDGTVDLHTTNFHSTPDTAFRVEPLAYSYHLLNRLEHPPIAVLTKLKAFLQNAGQALTIGGIHTPNHRWVVCMALAHIHHLFPDQAYLDRVDQWLSEGIDIDEDGQYTERSTTVYSPVVDKCLITVAKLLDKEALFEPVRKNLEMSLYYLRPNFQVSTEASGRQDRYQIGTAVRYYYPYRFMALKDDNGRFARVTRVLESDLASISHNLMYLLEDASLQNKLPDNQSLDTDFVKYFKGSSLVRIRRGDKDATVLSDNTLFFSFFKGNAALTGMRLASAFFGKGQFKADALEIKENRYRLSQYLEGPYYQPLENGTFLGTQEDFSKQRADSRVQSEVQKLSTVITITEQLGQFIINIDISGTDNVPVALELGFRKGGKLTGVIPIEGLEDAYLLNQGYLEYRDEKNTITVGPGQAAHKWAQLRGALPKMNGPSVYITGYTPVNWNLEVS